jgi:hypothetical protein
MQNYFSNFLPVVSAHARNLHCPTIISPSAGNRKNKIQNGAILKMKVKFFLGFALLGLSLASAKTYEISVDSVTKAGTVQLQPGLYKVSLTGSTVKFTNQDSGKSVETNGVVESNGKSKFDATALETQQVNGANVIQEIDLGGTPTKIKFAK